jgi:hypothetical protein
MRQGGTPYLIRPDAWLHSDHDENLICLTVLGRAQPAAVTCGFAVRPERICALILAVFTPGCAPAGARRA